MIFASSCRTGSDGCSAVDPVVHGDIKVDQYRYENDHASRFIEDCLKVEVELGKVSAKEHYNFFSQWSHENGFDGLISENIFSRRMEERGMKKKRNKASTAYVDVAVAAFTSTPF